MMIGYFNSKCSNRSSWENNICKPGSENKKFIVLRPWVSVSKLMGRNPVPKSRERFQTGGSYSNFFYFEWIIHQKINQKTSIVGRGIF